VTATVPKKFLIIPALVIAWVLLSGYFWWSTRLERHDGLAQRIADYYALEQKKQWAGTYAMRVPAFRQTMPLAEYQARMEKAATGWELKGIRVVYAVSDGDRVKVSVIFDEIGPPGVSGKKDPMIPNGTKVTSTEWSTWERIDGNWYAWETGVRSHLPLNAAPK
jgi:hypothetical protein